MLLLAKIEITVIKKKSAFKIIKIEFIFFGEYHAH